MKRTILATLAMVAMIGMLVTGCDRAPNAPLDENPPPGVSNESEAMKAMAQSDPFVANDEATFADREIQPMEYGTFGKIAAEITPLRIGRIILSVTVTTTVTIEPGDSLAVVRVEKLFNGIFKIKGLNGNGDTVLVEKPFVDKATRNVIFKRIRRDPRIYWRNWIPVATSLVDGGTISNPTVNIDITKLQLFLPNGDTITVTDPNSFYLRYRWLRLFNSAGRDVPELNGGDRVRLQATVVSVSSDTDFVALRVGFGFGHGRRTRMHLVSEVDNGNGTYTRVYEKAWFCHFHGGFFHAGVDAVTRETIYDDVAPYSVSWWGIPYRVL